MYPMYLFRFIPTSSRPSNFQKKSASCVLRMVFFLLSFIHIYGFVLLLLLSSSPPLLLSSSSLSTRTRYFKVGMLKRLPSGRGSKSQLLDRPLQIWIHHTANPTRPLLLDGGGL